MADKSGELGLEYEIDDRPPLLESILLGIQHISMMIVLATAMAFIAASAVGLGVASTAYVVQMVLLFSELATVVQAYAVGPVGSWLPIMMGTNFTFVGAATTIGIDYGLSAVFGAILITGSLVEGLIGWQFDRIKPFFPPLVTGLVVVIIDLYLVPVGMDYAAGGVGATDYGATHNIGLAAFVLGVAIALNLFTDGITRLLSTLVGIAVDYAVAVPLGVADFSPIVDATWFAIPQPGVFGVTFEPVPIVTFAFLFLVPTMETVGDMSGIIAAEGRNPTDKGFRGGLFTNGLMSSITSVFDAFPVTSFSQNMGIVNFTGVMSRHVVGITGIVPAVLGLSPKVGAAVATIPNAVFDGAVLLMAGMVTASGVRPVFLHTNLDRRNTIVVAASLGLELDVATRPDTLSGLPQAAATFSGKPIIVTALMALVLNTLASDDQSPPFDTADESVAADAAGDADGCTSTDD